MTAFKRVMNDGDRHHGTRIPALPARATGSTRWWRWARCRRRRSSGLHRPFRGPIEVRSPCRPVVHLGPPSLVPQREFAWRSTMRAGPFANAASSQKKSRKSAGRCGFAVGVEKFCQADPRVAATSEIWDRDPGVLGRPTEWSTSPPASGAKPAARIMSPRHRRHSGRHADRPRWLRFLDEATAGDTGSQRFLQLWIAIGLTAFIREHALAFVYGDGGTGKTTFVNCISRPLADYAITAQMQTFTASKFDHHSQDIASLRGAAR